MQSTLRAFLNIFPEKMKKRTLWYLFDRYLGHFLREKLTLDQLSVDLIDGKGCINDIGLDVDSLNEELSFLPFQFIDGCFIDEISVYVPWSALLTESCSLQINGSTFICQLIEPIDKGKSMGESDYLSRSIMSSSMQLAEEIVHEVEEEKFEGLEIFAQLIDSVLRRVELIASNTTFVLRGNPYKGSGATVGGISIDQSPSEIEIKVKYLKCEENCPEEEGENKREDVSLAPRLISKKLTVENVEVFMDGTSICSLENKHVMEIKVKDSRCDVQVYLASILTAIVKAHHLDKLIKMFTTSETCEDKVGAKEAKGGEKTMSPTDYARIEQQLQMDVANLNTTTNNLTYSMLIGNQTAWTSGSGGGGGGSNYSNNDAKFLPLNDVYNQDDNRYSEKQETSIKTFHCTIKLPGLVVCLVDAAFDVAGIRIDPKAANLEAINSLLDEHISCYHLKCITMPIQIDYSSNSVKIVSGDILIAEKNHRGVTPLLWTEPREAKSQQRSISFQCDINRERIKMISRNITHLTIDPTLLERLDNYLPLQEGSSSSLEYRVTFKCDQVKAKLLFPVPDLRSDVKLTHSELRQHWMNFEAHDVTFQTNLLTHEVFMDQLTIFLANQSGCQEIGKVSGRGSELIKIAIKRGPSTALLVDNEDMINTVLTEADMEESIYIGSSDHHEIGPFQTKRKVIKSTKDDDEQVVTPNDRSTSIKYFETCQSLTQLQIEVSAHLLHVMLETKAQLDTLYNSFGNDLALWKPIRKPSSIELPEAKGSKVNPVSSSSSSSNKPQAYFTCKSGLAESMDSDSSFHSAEGSLNHRMQNSATCNIHADNVELRIGPSCCDHVIQGSDVFLGLAIGLEEDTCNVVSIHGNDVSWLYNEQVMITSNYFLGLTSSLNLTFEINTKEPSSKRIKFALQLADAVLLNTQFDIFTDLWTYINVTNDEVLGYVPPNTLTELHINVVNAAIAYDKLSCPRSALFTIDGAYVTAMVVENTSETLIRFILEETALYFRKNSLSRDCLKNYVCIVDSGLIDLNLKLSDDFKIDFKASNNIINIRVCNDSLTALLQLVQSVITDNSSSSNSNDGSSEKLDDDLPLYSAVTGQTHQESCESQDMIMGGLSSEMDEAAAALFELENPPLIPRNFNYGIDPGNQPTNSQLNDSGFWILGDDDVGAGIKATVEPTIRVLVNEPIKVIDNYFGVTKARPLPEIMESVVERYLLEEMTLMVNIYGGRDFEDEPNEEKDNEKESFTTAPESSRRSESKVRFVDNSIHLWESLDLKSAPNFFQTDASGANLPSNFKSMGGRFRQNDVCVQLFLSKVKSVFDKFDETCPTSWMFVFMVNEIEIRDRVSRSNINKMLYEYSSENLPRRNFANMVYIRATTFRNPIDNNEECDLKISVKPLRINIDQDTIIFLTEFFGTLKCLAEMSGGGDVSGDTCSSPVNPDVIGTCLIQEPIGSSVSDCSEEPLSYTGPASSKPSSLFIKSFLFSPDVPIRLDYHGKRVDFEQGALPGLLMGLAHLNQSELRLKKLHQKHGILGLDRVLSYALMEWFEDIKRHQLPSIIGSIGPMNSVRQLIQGLIDLVWIPVDQYRRDRRLVRGIQRGASSFSSSTAMAVIDLANRLVHVIQGTAQFAHDVVSSSSRSPQPNTRGSVPTSQPRDLREGVATAYTVMREGLNQTYRNVASAGMQAEGYSDAVGGLIRQIPSNIFQPIIKVSEATSNVLVGMRNQLTPEARKEDQDKWKC